MLLVSTRPTSKALTAASKYQWPILVALLFVSILAAQTVAAEKDGVVKGEAPPDHAVLTHTRGGAFFVPKDLKEKYDQLLARVGRLKADVAAGNISGEAALEELKTLEPQLESLRKELQAKKVLVSPVKIQKQTEELTFDLGTERLLIITADRVRVIGWDQPKIKCVLEKTLLSGNDKPQTEEFKALRLTHRLGPAADLVGKTAEAIAAEETKFLAEHADKPIPEAQLAGRRQLVAEIQDSHAPYRDFQGKEVDIVGIEGLSGAEGNRQITVDLRSTGGGRNLGSDWRRQAMLTVYVPACQGVLLRGCLQGVDVEGLKSPLVVTDDGSLDRDYDGSFQIKKLDGSLALYNVPLDRLEQVQGDVKIIATVEYANTGTHYEDGQRTTIIPPPRECTVDAITGNFSAWFARVNLKLGTVSGMIDVKNETGDTTFNLTAALAEQAHRIVSESGRIDVRLKLSALGKLPVMALTTEGTVKTNADQAAFEDTNFTTGSAADGGRRDWRGVQRRPKQDPGAMFEAFQRPAAALRGAERPAGLDLISRFGTVNLNVTP